MDILLDILVSADTAIAWAATAVVGLIGKFLVDKIKSEKVRLYVGRALDEVYDAVAEVYQVYVAELKEAKADGKLTQEEKDKAKHMAVETAKANIGAKGLARLARVLGIDSIDQWLESKVEATIARKKEDLLAPLSLSETR